MFFTYSSKKVHSSNTFEELVLEMVWEWDDKITPKILLPLAVP